MRKVKAKKLKKIVTVYRSHKYAKEFDKSVNDLLEEGYRLGEFRIVEAPQGQIHDMLYARLEWWE